MPTIPYMHRVCKVLPYTSHSLSSQFSEYWLCALFSQVGVIGADRKFRVLSEAEVADYLQEVE